MSKKQIVILGGGRGGTMTANGLRRPFHADEAETPVVDRDNRHVYQPGLLFVPFGLASLDELARPRVRQLRRGVVFHEAEVAWVELDHDEVVRTLTVENGALKSDPYGGKVNWRIVPASVVR